MNYKPRRAAKRWLQGAPEYVLGCWDNGGRSFDRYTVAIGGSLYAAPAKYQDPRLVPMVAMSHNPTHPQGFSQWTEGLRGPHLGKKVRWLDLPEHIRAHVISRCTED